MTPLVAFVRRSADSQQTSRGTCPEAGYLLLFCLIILLPRGKAALCTTRLWGTIHVHSSSPSSTMEAAHEEATCHWRPSASSGTKRDLDKLGHWELFSSLAFPFGSYYQTTTKVKFTPNIPLVMFYFLSRMVVLGVHFIMLYNLYTYYIYSF